jgi:hypothetical protein
MPWSVFKYSSNFSLSSFDSWLSLLGDASMQRRASKLPQFVAVKGGAYFFCQAYAPYVT